MLLVQRGTIMTDERKNTNEEQRSKKRSKRKGKPRRHGSGSVFRRPERKGKQWVAQIILEDGTPKQRYFNSEKEADEARNEMLHEQRQGTLITEKDQTVKQHFERWLEIHKTRIRWSTYLGYRRVINKHILPTLGHLSLQRLSARKLS